jgi:hypothetical protein
MIGVFLLAAGVAGANVAVWLWIQRRCAQGARFWQAQLLGFLFRFCMIFGGATWLWWTWRRMPEVVVFILVGTIVQTAGQSYFFLRKGTPHA